MIKIHDLCDGDSTREYLVRPVRLNKYDIALTPFRFVAFPRMEELEGDT